MKNYNGSEIKINISKVKASAWTLVAFGFLSVLLWASFEIWNLPSGFNKTFLFIGITLLTSSAGLACISGLKKLTDSPYGLIINDNGIQINLGPNRGQFINWRDITALKIYNPVRGPMTLLIFIKNPDEFLSNLGWFRRSLLKMNKVTHKTPVSLTSNWLNCSFEELVKTVENKYKENRPNNFRVPN